MLRRKFLVGRQSNPRVGCDHRYHITVIFTELGCHARCLDCEALGPERPSSKAARQALLVLGARTDDGRYLERRRHSPSSSH